MIEIPAVVAGAFVLLLAIAVYAAFDFKMIAEHKCRMGTAFISQAGRIRKGGETMTDAEIRKNVNAVQEVIDGCDDSSISEKVRYTWASCAARWCREIADEMERRLKGSTNEKTDPA